VAPLGLTTGPESRAFFAPSSEETQTSPFSMYATEAASATAGAASIKESKMSAIRMRGVIPVAPTRCLSVGPGS
jgi:hypothetical protein